MLSSLGQRPSETAAGKPAVASVQMGGQTNMSILAGARLTFELVEPERKTSLIIWTCMGTNCGVTGLETETNQYFTPALAANSPKIAKLFDLTVC